MDNLHQEKQAKGLISIKLYDSYMGSFNVKIDCGGHTNIAGGNGAGKTTALALIPIFYGLPPESLINRSAGKDSFLDHYLPFNRSMVIFEYIGNNGVCCVVLYRHSLSKGDQLVYRFVKGSADSTIFHPAFKHLLDQNVPASELLKSLENAGINISRQLSTADYRYILCNQYDKKNRNMGFMQLSSDFSLCAINKKMEHMGELTSVLQSNNHLLKHLKTMLYDSQIKNTIDIGERPVHDKDKNLIEMIRSVSKLVEQKDILLKSRQETEVLAKIHEGFGQHQYHIECLKNEYDNRQNENNKKIEVKETDKATLNTSYNAEYQEDTREKLKLEEVIENYNKRLDILDKEYNSYKQQNIQFKKNEYKMLGFYKGEVNNQQSELNILQSSQNKILEEFAQLKIKILGEETEQVKQLELDLTGFEREFNEKNNKIKDDLKKHEHDTELKLEDMRKKHQANLDQLEIEKTNCTVAYEVAKKPTDEEEIALQNLYELKDINIDQIRSVDAYITECKNTLRENERKKESERENYEKYHNNILNVDKELDKFRQLVNPNGTLLAYLNEESLNWREDIAKVINPKLLLSKDLHPEWVQVIEKSFYGLSIDLDLLDIPVEAEQKDDLIQRIQKLDKERQNYVDKQITIKASIDSIDSVIKKIALDISTYEYKQKQLQTEESDLAKAIINLKENQEKSAKLRIDTANIALNRAKERLQEQKVHNSEQYEKVKKVLVDRKLQINDDIEQLSKEFNKQKDVIKIKKNKASQSKDERIINLENRKNSELEKEGVNLETLKRVKNKLEDAEKKYQETLEYYEIILQYEQWMEFSYAQKPELEHNLGYAQLAADELINNMRVKKEYYLQELKLFDQQIKELQSLNKSIENDQSQLIKLEKSIEEVYIDIPRNELYQIDKEEKMPPFELLAGAIQQDVVLFRDKMKSIKNIYSNILSIFKEGDARFDQALTNRMSRYVHIPLHTIGYYMQAMKEVAGMMDYDIPQEQRACIENFRAVGGKMVNYYHGVNEFNKKVKKVSATLTQEINQEQFFENISDIKLELSSILSQYEDLSGLRSFVERYKEYDEGQRELPNEALLSAFEENNRILMNIPVGNTNSSEIIDLKLSFKENGRLVNVKMDNDLRSGSSTGLSMLLLVTIFSSLTRYLCKDESVKIHWPLDELSVIDGKNTTRLFELMNKKNIVLFTATPKLDHSMSAYFECKHHIDREIGIRRYKAKEISDTNPLLLGGES